MIQIFRSVLARKVPATLACARLSDSIVGRIYNEQSENKKRAYPITPKKRAGVTVGHKDYKRALFAK